MLLSTLPLTRSTPHITTKFSSGTNESPTSRYTTRSTTSNEVKLPSFRPTAHTNAMNHAFTLEHSKPVPTGHSNPVPTSMIKKSSPTAVFDNSTSMHAVNVHTKNYVKTALST